MDNFEKIGYACLALVAVAYVVVLVVGAINAFPMGLLGLLALLGMGVLAIKVIGERLRNREDDHYSKNVDQ